MNDMDKFVNDTFNKNKLHKINNNLYLKKEEIDILEKYGINYSSLTIDELLFKIEYILNDNYIEELDKVSFSLSEFNYYNYTNK